MFVISVPEAPQNLTYRNLSSTSIEVSWDPPTSFNGPNEGYEVMYIRIETNVSNTIPNISETSVNISGLEKYELYSVQVVALSDKGPGDEIEITILTDEDGKLVIKIIFHALLIIFLQYLE